MFIIIIIDPLAKNSVYGADTPVEDTDVPINIVMLTLREFTCYGKPEDVEGIKALTGEIAHIAMIGQYRTGFPSAGNVRSYREIYEKDDFGAKFKDSMWIPTPTWVETFARQNCKT